MVFATCLRGESRTGPVDSPGVSDPNLPNGQSQGPVAGEAPSLQRRMARGLTWTLLESWGSPLVGLVVFIVLARLLTEADFGLVALASVFMFFVHTTVDQGLGEALIQRSVIGQRTISTAFWVTVLTGSVMTLVGIVVAGPLAVLLGEPELEPILQALSVTFIVTGFASTPMALLRREFAFRQLAIRRLVAVVAAGAIAVALAFAGFGAWALVAQHVANAVISLIVLWAVLPWRPTREVSLDEFRELFRYGRNVLGGEMLNFLSRHADNLLIGVYLGTVALGLYAVAYKILDITQQLLVTAVQKVAFPAFARLQHDRERLAAAYQRLVRSASLVILPGYVGLALVADEAIVLLFGVRWAPSAAPAAVLLLIGPVLALQAFSGALFNSVGHPEVTLRFRLISTIVNVAGFVIAVAFFRDITAVAAAFVIRGYVLLPLIFWWLRRYVGLPLRAHLNQLRTPIVATGLMAVLIVGVKLGIGGVLPAGLLLAVELAVGVAAFAAAVLVLDRAMVRDTSAFLLQAVPGGERARSALGLADREELRALDAARDDGRSVDA